MPGHQEQSIVRYPAGNGTSGETLNQAESAALDRQFRYHAMMILFVSEGA